MKIEDIRITVRRWVDRRGFEWVIHVCVACACACVCLYKETEGHDGWRVRERVWFDKWAKGWVERRLNCG